MKRGASGINALIAIDKPTGPSSHDIVGRARRILGERRVGHAGTLDPAASGVLLVGVGQATRLMGRLTLDTKSYEARITFGCETDTDDAEGSPTRMAEIPEQLSDPAYAREVLRGLVGKHKQLPPAYSAISVGGKRSYERARAGEPVELEARPIEIFEAELLSVAHEEEALSWDCRLLVSKGTYIRSIARDLGRELASAAHLTVLRRTSSGSVGIADCVTLEVLEALGTEGVSRAFLDPVALLSLPVRHLSASEIVDVACGRRIPVGSELTGQLAQGDEVSLVASSALYGIWKRSGSYLVCSTNFPAGISGVSS